MPDLSATRNEKNGSTRPPIFCPPISFAPNRPVNMWCFLLSHKFLDGSLRPCRSGHNSFSSAGSENQEHFLLRVYQQVSSHQRSVLSAYNRGTCSPQHLLHRADFARSTLEKNGYSRLVSQNKKYKTFGKRFMSLGYVGGLTESCVYRSQKEIQDDVHILKRKTPPSLILTLSLRQRAQDHPPPPDADIVHIRGTGSRI